MDINLLALNLGNSRLAIAVFIAGKLEYVSRVSTDQRSEWRDRVAEAWKRLQDTDSPAIAAASVNPSLIEALEHAAEQATDQSVQWIGKDIDLPIPVLTDPPTDTGVDRILNVAAAYEQMQKACVVVDAGTAITINCCNDKGEFLGGSISPGISMMLDALHEKTAKLPRIPFARPEGAFGASTQQAILHGIYHGTRGMVKEIVENFATDLGVWPDIIATGGDALSLFEGWELIHAIAPDLTLYGIALAYTEHQLKHEA